MMIYRYRAVQLIQIFLALKKQWTTFNFFGAINSSLLSSKPQHIHIIITDVYDELMLNCSRTAMSAAMSEQFPIWFSGAQ